MASTSNADRLIDAATEAHADALGLAYNAQHALHNAIVSMNFAWEQLTALAEGLANREGGEPGPLFKALEALREDPTLRRKIERAV